MIRPATPGDAEAIAAIYEPYVRASIATFEEAAVPADEIGRRIAAVGAKGLPYLVAEHDGRMIGYAYATEWKGRSAYRFSAETTIYVDPSFAGRGHGTVLYRHVLDQLAEGAIHAAVGAIALPNPSSVALHEKLGFRKVGHLPEVGRKFGRWIDVGYWHRLL